MTVVMNRKQWHSIFKEKIAKLRFELSTDSSGRVRHHSLLARGRSARYAREFSFARYHDEVHGFGAGNFKDWTFNLSNSTNRRAKCRGKISLFRIEGNKTADCCA